MTTRRLLAVLLPAIMIAMLLAVTDPLEARNSIMSSFAGEYGQAMVAQYSCDLCHFPGTTNLNPYGEDLRTAMGGGGDGGCGSYYPPSDHTVRESEDGCVAYHKPGHEHPFANGCTACHGSDLRGGSAPSCYTCHGEEWGEDDDDDDDDAPPPSAWTAEVQPAASGAFGAIEQLDSDRDGFSNIEEITALKNPGDPDSYPGASTDVTVAMRSTWKRNWAVSKGDIKVTIRAQSGTLVDTAEPIYLETSFGRLASTRVTAAGAGVYKALYPKALLLAALSDPGTDKADLVVEGMTATGERFTAAAKVSFSGKDEVLVEKLGLKANPRKFSTGAELGFTLSGGNAELLDAGKTIWVNGPSGRAKLADVRKSGAKIVGKLSAKDATAIFGTTLTGVGYTVSLSGYGLNNGVLFAVATTMKTTDGTVVDCIEYNPPASHTVARVQGQCTYYHAPGAATPEASGCTACHGADLKGSGFAPSCTECHGKIW